MTIGATAYPYPLQVNRRKRRELALKRIIAKQSHKANWEYRRFVKNATEEEKEEIRIFENSRVESGFKPSVLFFRLNK